MRKLFLLLSLIVVAGNASAAEVPKKYEPELQKALPGGQKVVQTLVADLDKDGKPEWIAVGEPDSSSGEVSVGIFTPAQGKKGPELRFAQGLRDRLLSTAGATVMDLPLAGKVVVLVGAAPVPSGDSTFVVQMYGWTGSRFKPMIPERLTFRSQGGFAIEDVDPATPGKEIVAWSYERGEREQLHDHHVYEWNQWHWDGLRYTNWRENKKTETKMPNPDAAARAAGVKGGDLRRQMPRVATVP